MVMRNQMANCIIRVVRKVLRELNGEGSFDGKKLYIYIYMVWGVEV